jgi:hypothetical protein
MTVWDGDLEPADLDSMAILGPLSPEDRLLAAMAVSEWTLAGLRGAFHERHPEWSQRRVNLEALAWGTPLRGKRIREFIENESAFVLS